MKPKSYFAWCSYVYLRPLRSMKLLMIAHMFWVLQLFRASCKLYQNCHWHWTIIGSHRHHTQLAHWTTGSQWSSWCNVSLAFLRRNQYQIDVIFCVQSSSKQAEYTWIVYIIKPAICVTSFYQFYSTPLFCCRYSFTCVDSYISIDQF